MKDTSPSLEHGLVGLRETINQERIMIKDIAKILIAMFDIILGLIPLVLGFFWETISNCFCSGRCYSRELSRWIKN